MSLQEATQKKRIRKMAGAQTPLFTALLIDGELVAGQGFVEPILNPATGEVLTQIAEASIEQVEAAILAAHRAFASWSRTTPQQRSNLLLDIANAIEKNADLLARLESMNCGKPLHLARQDDLSATVDVFRFFAGGRVEDWLDNALPRDQFSIDQQGGEQRGLRASHFSGSLFLCGLLCRHGSAPCDWGPAVFIGCNKTSSRARGQQILNTEGGVRLNRWLTPAVGLFAGDRQERVHQRRSRGAATPGQADIQGLAEVGDRSRFDDVTLQ